MLSYRPPLLDPGPASSTRLSSTLLLRPHQLLLAIAFSSVKPWECCQKILNTKEGTHSLPTMTATESLGMGNGMIKGLLYYAEQIFFFFFWGSICVENSEEGNCSGTKWWEPKSERWQKKSNIIEWFMFGITLWRVTYVFYSLSQSTNLDLLYAQEILNIS